MQLVGATNMYIRMPFIAEGMLAGLLGAAIAIGALALAEHQIVPKLASTLAFISFRVNGGCCAWSCWRSARRSAWSRPGSASGGTCARDGRGRPRRARAGPPRWPRSALALAPRRARRGRAATSTTEIQQQQAKLHDVHSQAARQAGSARERQGPGRLDRLAARRHQPQHRRGQRPPGRAAGPACARPSASWPGTSPARRRQGDPQRHQDVLNRRLVDAYEHGDLGYVDVLLRARSFADFVERWNDIRYLVKSNQSTIRARRADAAKVAAIESGLLGTRRELQSQQARCASSGWRSTRWPSSASGLLAAADAAAHVGPDPGRPARRDVGPGGSPARGPDPPEAARGRSGPRRGGPRARRRRAAQLAGGRRAAVPRRPPARPARSCGRSRARSPRPSATACTRSSTG